MCGIFGIFSSSNKLTCPPCVTVKLASSQLARGRHAWGIAWIDRTGIIRSHKAIGPVTNGLDLIASVAQEAVALIGHTRWATHGNPEDLACAHPFTCDGGYIVHNGIVGNHEELAREWGVIPTSECDSEVLARCIECYKDRAKGMELTINDTAREYPLALAGLWSGPKPEVVVARRGNPLYMGSLKVESGKTSGRAHYFASTPTATLDMGEVGDNRVVRRVLFTKGPPQTTKLAAGATSTMRVCGSNLFED